MPFSTVNNDTDNGHDGVSLNCLSIIGRELRIGNGPVLQLRLRPKNKVTKCRYSKTKNGVEQQLNWRGLMKKKID